MKKKDEKATKLLKNFVFSSYILMYKHKHVFWSNIILLMLLQFAVVNVHQVISLFIINTFEPVKLVR